MAVCRLRSTGRAVADSCRCRPHRTPVSSLPIGHRKIVFMQAWQHMMVHPALSLSAQVAAPIFLDFAWGSGTQSSAYQCSPSAVHFFFNCKSDCSTRQSADVPVNMQPAVLLCVVCALVMTSLQYGSGFRAAMKTLTVARLGVGMSTR